MRITISFLTENEQYKNVLAESTKEDIIYLFHLKQNDKIPMSVTKDLCSAKCKVEFIEIDDEKNAERELAYQLGVLTERYGEVTILSKDPVLSYFNKKANKEAKPARKVKSVERNEKPNTVDDAPRRTRRKKEVNDVETPRTKATPKAKTEPKAEPKEKVERKKRAVKVERAVNIDSDDAAYYEGMEKLKKLISDAGFEANDYIFCVTKAVRDIDVKNEPFSKTIKYHCPEIIAEKLAKSLQKKEEEMKQIVSTMVDEKY